MKKNRFPVMTVALAAAALLGITVWRAALENGAQEEKKDFSPDRGSPVPRR